MAGKEIRTPDGTLIITEEAVAAIAAAAALDCPGIAGMATRGIQEGLADMLGHPSLARGVDVTLTAEGARIVLDVLVTYGTRIAQAAEEVAARVRQAVEALTGISVIHLELRVQGVRPARPPLPRR